MIMGKDDKDRTINNHFEAGSNCQVFNGDISGCVFAMPGASVTQQVAQPRHGEGDEEREAMTSEEESIVSQLKPIFFGIEEDARKFLVSIRGMKSTQITAKVNELVDKRKISDKSQHRDLWKVLHECGIYTKSEANWNMQVR